MYLILFLFDVVILNGGPAAGPVKDPCISSPQRQGTPTLVPVQTTSPTPTRPPASRHRSIAPLSPVPDRPLQPHSSLSPNQPPSPQPASSNPASAHPPR